jgi:6-phosphogluconolactonase
MCRVSATRVPRRREEDYIVEMRRLLCALFLFSCGTSQDVQDASATTDASADVATESAPVDAADASATLGLPRVYIGASDGIHVCSFDTQTHALAQIDTTAVAGGNPSFLAFDSARTFLYAVDETNSNVLAFSIDETSGKLTSIGKVPSLGSGPANVALDRKDALVMVANYGNGTIAIYPRGSDGKLADASATYSFGAAAHSHEILADPSNAFVLVPNLGLNGVGVFRRDAGALSYLGLTPAGTGARHMTFDPAGTHAWIIDETASTITAFDFDAQSGSLSQIQQLSSLYGTSPTGNTGAEIAVTNDGTHVLASNRGDDSIVVFDVAQDGKLTPKARVSTNGNTPRHFSIDETGRFLFVGNQTSNTVVTMTMDPVSGVPSAVGTALGVTGPEFVALVYLP